MGINRREFIAGPAVLAGALMAPAQEMKAQEIPWQRKVRRLGQLNMTEHDPVVLNVEEWADYWVSLKVDATLVSVTGFWRSTRRKFLFTGRDDIWETGISSVTAAQPRRSEACA